MAGQSDEFKQIKLSDFNINSPLRFMSITKPACRQAGAQRIFLASYFLFVPPMAPFFSSIVLRSKKGKLINFLYKTFAKRGNEQQKINQPDYCLE